MGLISPVHGIQGESAQAQERRWRRLQENNVLEKEGELPCGVRDCDNFADKSMGGRSLSVDDAIDMWGSNGYETRKGRVRVCKSCYRKWKKENKNDEMY